MYIYDCDSGTGNMQIIRGVAIGLSLIMYGQEENADTLIEEMTRDQDPILRCSTPPAQCHTYLCPHALGWLCVRDG